MRRWGVVLVFAIAVTLLVGRWASMVFANWQWFAALGALPVYRSQLAHELAWRAGAAVAAFTFALLNLYALRRSIISLVLPRRLGNIEIGEAVPGPLLLAVVVGVSSVLAILLSSPPDDWTTFAFARIAEPFREMDPYLDRDLSFGVAWLPFELELHRWAATVMVVVSALTITLYAVTPSLRLRRGGLYVSSYCRRHLATLAAIGLVLLAWRCRLDGVSLTSLGTDAGHPFGAYEYRLGMVVATWVSVLTAVAAFLVFWAGWHGYARMAAVAGLTACIGGPLVQAALPTLAGRGLTAAEQREQDRPFATTRRLYTRRAFGVDRIVDGSVRSSTAATPQALVAGLPSWDPAAVLRSATAATGSRAAGLAWTEGAALQSVVIVAPRLDGSLWHGERVEMTTTDERGRLLGALPPELPEPAALLWDRPLVHEQASAFLVVTDTAGHIPAPRFELALERIAHAWSLRSPRLLVSSEPAARQRVVFRRDVRERIEALAPFLTVGPTIAPLVRGDTLFWTAELFTTARTYPLSDRLMFAGAPRAYVHHAATAFVHAGTGRVLLVADPDSDAILRTWMRRFPFLFTRPTDAPAALVDVRAPAVDWAAIQATALARTGVGESPDAPRAAVGVDNADADLVDAPPSVYAPRGSAGPLAWSVPLVDASGAVMGVLVAPGGSPTRTAWFPASRGDRWSDVLDRLQRTADSAGVGRQRRNARRGRVLVVPVGGSILYAQAHYEWPPDAAPVLTGVAMMQDGAARAGATLADALGARAGRVARGDAAFRAAVAALHRRMGDALRRGDWSAFGAAFEALGNLLRSPGR